MEDGIFIGPWMVDCYGKLVYTRWFKPPCLNFIPDRWRVTISPLERVTWTHHPKKVTAWITRKGFSHVFVFFLTPSFLFEGVLMVSWLMVDWLDGWCLWLVGNYSWLRVNGWWLSSSCFVLVVLNLSLFFFSKWTPSRKTRWVVLVQKKCFQVTSTLGIVTS